VSALQYQYLAVNTKNRKTRGQITANDKAEAISLLQEQGLIALELTAAGGSDAEADSIWSKQLGSSDIHNIKIPKKTANDHVAPDGDHDEVRRFSIHSNECADRRRTG
jgi:hypothetical protein